MKKSAMPDSAHYISKRAAKKSVPSGGESLPSQNANDRLRAAIYDIAQDGRYPGWKQDLRSVLDSNDALMAALQKAIEFSDRPNNSQDEADLVEELKAALAQS